MYLSQVKCNTQMGMHHGVGRAGAPMMTSPPETRVPGGAMPSSSSLS